MQTVVIQVENSNDGRLLMEIARKMGFTSFVASPEESRWMARQKLAGLVEAVQPSGDENEPEMTEIQSIVDDIRAKHHEAAKN